MEYTPKVWQTGEKITADDLNRIEDGLGALTEEIANLGGGLLTVEVINVGGNEDGESETVAVTGLTLDLSTYSATVGDSFYINPVVSPSNATNKSVSWDSSNTGVATVDSSGYVECVADGDAVITCTTVDGGYTATCTVSVAAADSGETAGQKVQLSTLERSDGLMKGDGTIVALTSTYHVQVPYTDGMFISTAVNNSWDTSDYPSVVVLDDGVYTKPEMEFAENTTSVGGKNPTQCVTTLTGYSANAVVYVSFLAGTTTSKPDLATNMDNAGIYYYIPGGES